MIRRRFLLTGGGALAAHAAHAASPADQVSLGVIGSGSRGTFVMTVFQKDPAARHDLIRDIFAAGMQLGGAISGEHGIGTEKKVYLAELEDPVKLALMRRIKAAFDPAGILNPGTIFDHEAYDPEP